MTASPTPPPAGREFYREQLRHCCGEQGTPEGGFCESWGCSSVVDLLAMADAAERRAEIAIALAEDKNVFWMIAQTGEARAEVQAKTEQLEAAERRAAELEELNAQLNQGIPSMVQDQQALHGLLGEADDKLAAAERENEQANADIVTLTNLLDSVGRAAARENERLRKQHSALRDAIGEKIFGTKLCGEWCPCCRRVRAALAAEPREDGNDAR